MSILAKLNQVNHAWMLSTISCHTGMKLGQCTPTLQENSSLPSGNWVIAIKHQQSMWTVRSHLLKERSDTCLRALAQILCSPVSRCSTGQWLCSISQWPWTQRHSSMVMMPRGSFVSMGISQVSRFLSVQNYCFGTIQKGLTTHLGKHHQLQMMEYFWDTTYNLFLHGRVSILLPSWKLWRPWNIKAGGRRRAHNLCGDFRFDAGADHWKG